MIQLSTLNQWLQQPRSLGAPEVQEQVAELIKTYPYFAPAHLLQATVQHRARPFAPEMLGKMQLYTGNWLLFYEMLQQTAAPETIIETAPQELFAAAPAVPETVAEPVKAETPVARAEEQGNKVHEVVDNINMDHNTVATEPLIQPVFTEDYFLHQGIAVSEDIPAEIDRQQEEEEDKSLLVVMSFSEWLAFFKKKSEKEKEEEEDKKALKSMWQKEKLAAAMEEENDEIPESVFEMAVNSITKEEGLISESLAEILIKQGKYDKAVDMYRKLSLRNPQKNTYFAHKIEAILKDKES